MNIQGSTLFILLLISSSCFSMKKVDLCELTQESEKRIAADSLLVFLSSCTVAFFTSKIPDHSLHTQRVLRCGLFGGLAMGLVSLWYTPENQACIALRKRDRFLHSKTHSFIQDQLSLPEKVSREYDESFGAVSAYQELVLWNSKLESARRKLVNASNSDYMSNEFKRECLIQKGAIEKQCNTISEIMKRLPLLKRWPSDKEKYDIKNGRTSRSLLASLGISIPDLPK